MYVRSLGLGCVAMFLLALSGGCGKPSQPAASSVTQARPETVARLHWLGKKRLGVETNAASFMKLWSLPESARLEAQALDKLASAPWRLPQGIASLSNAPAATTNLQPPASLLRPLLQDLLQEECYMEVQQATNEPGAVALAVRLDDQQFACWQTNLAAVLESLLGTGPVPASTNALGWTLKKTGMPGLIELTRVGAWTLLGMAPTNNALLSELSARIQREGAPCAQSATNFWLESEFDARRLGAALACGWDLPEGLPKLSLTLSGNGENVLSRARLTFPKPLPFEIQPWNIPTNLIHDPLVSFTALQGLAPWLSALSLWTGLNAGDPPSQVYFWAQRDLPFLAQGAAYLPGGSNAVWQLSERLVAANPWMTNNAMGWFQSSPAEGQVLWREIPMAAPFLQWRGTPEPGLAFGGLVPILSTNEPPPFELFQQLAARTNLVGYDWELTGTRIEPWLHIGQLLRLVFKQSQMAGQSAGLTWLQALAPKLGNCATAITRTAPDELSFARSSTIGFTGLELHLLADWLESPEFPLGLHTLKAPPPAAFRYKPRTGLPPVRPAPGSTKGSNALPVLPTPRSPRP